MPFDEFSFSLSNLLAFKSDDFLHGVNDTGIDLTIWDFVDRHVWVKREIGVGRSVGFYFSKTKFHLRSSKRLNITESVLKELE
jgi:hypothetical protein